MRALVAGIADPARAAAVCLRLAADAAARGERARIALWIADAPSRELIATLATRGAELLTLSGEAADPRMPAELVARAIEFCGGLDAVYCDTGARGEPASLLEATVRDWDRFAATTVRAPLLLCQAAYPALRESTGAVAIVAGRTGTAGDPEHGLESMSSAAVIMVSRMLSQDWASEGIQVNSVSPARESCDNDALAGTVAFLLSRDSSYVTGEDFPLEPVDKHH